MRSKEKKKGNILKKLVIVGLFLICIGVVINLAPNYIQNELEGKTNLIINNNNVTLSLKHDIKVDDKGIVYLSSEDIGNFFDGDIFYDNKYNQIITTSETKVATIELDKKEMYVNGSKVNIYAVAYKNGKELYIPISEIKEVYNIDINYSKDTDIVTIDSIDREQKKGNSAKDTKVKYRPTIFSKTVDEVKKGESIIVIGEESGWYKVRTSSGIIGYIKNVANIYNSRESIEPKKQIEGKVSLVWDYYTSKVPERTGTINGINVISPTIASLKEQGRGELVVKAGESGKQYINWAHNNEYKVWGIISNDSFNDTTSDILNDYKLREKLINSILLLTTNYNLDGINIDFENMYEADKAMFSQFIIELAPRLKEYGKVLSVDVTAPDGSPNWSLCYDRHKISQVADYIIFMAYDQYGDSSDKAGTTAGADWVEVNIKKFLGQEGVEKDKLILGMPLYTRLWKETGDKPKSSVVLMKSIDKTLPSNVERKWNEDLKQYYVEYNQNGVTYKMWLEEEKSIKAKFELMRNYDLAGAAYWQKDFETSNFWNIVETEINK